MVPVPQGYKAAGILNLDLALTGTPQELLSSGTILLNDGVIQIPKIATPLTRITSYNVCYTKLLRNLEIVLENANIMSA